MNDRYSHARSRDWAGIFRTAVNPSMEAAGKTSCFSRSGKCLPNPDFCDRLFMNSSRLAHHNLSDGVEDTVSRRPRRTGARFTSSGTGTLGDLRLGQ
jgi:hypothetical protein